MQSEKQIEFNFKKIESDHTAESYDTNLVDMVSNTFSTQIVMLLSYILAATLILKITSINLLDVAFILSKGLITLNAISYAFKYWKQKKLKEQLLNGALNLGILLYVFKYDGFNTLVSFINSLVNLY